MLRASGDEVAGELDRVRGCREWGLRVSPRLPDADDHADTAAHDEPGSRDDGRAAGVPGAGHAEDGHAGGSERADDLAGPTPGGYPPAGAAAATATRTAAAARAGPSTSGAATGVAGGTGLAGTDYLAARRDELRRAALREAHLTELARRAHEELAVLAAEATLRSGRPGPGRLDAAYLVPSAREREFLDAAAAAVRELEDAGCEARVTGPWPPYSFVGLTLGEVRP
ncbi:MAG: GvpL/GvpF family gas vesicle protein [Frankia sp.]|nr:GvpL/GvpF family gas vesicle protein [Frankia sp.]